MTQSASTALSPGAESSSAGQTGDLSNRSGDASSQTARLGYEVLYNNRRPGRLHLPLSLPAAESSRSSTGSALLDSFERDRAQKSMPLRNLRLIATTGLQATALTQPVLEISPKQPAVGKGNPAAPPAPTNLAALPSLAPDELPRQGQPQPQPQPKQTPSKQAPSKQTPSKQTPSKQAPSRRPELEHSPKRLPASKHPLSARLGHLPVNTGKVARDSAAAVGLLDLNDTLLFGGDHEDLSCVDPFVAFQSSVKPAEVLDYLSHQISAFTVERLKHNFPITTHLDVLNRVEPPAYGTVLESQFFRLKDLLADEDREAENSAELSSSDSLSPPSADLDAVEIHALSKQVQDLNKKIEYLSRKLEEATGE
ncbi:MAG: hypothetical protein AAFS06_00915 [Cyanobacteria bacterium J06631_12]